jgi:hypothetical protein
LLDGGVFVVTADFLNVTPVRNPIDSRAGTVWWLSGPNLVGHLQGAGRVKSVGSEDRDTKGNDVFVSDLFGLVSSQRLAVEQSSVEGQRVLDEEFARKLCSVKREHSVLTGHNSRVEPCVSHSRSKGRGLLARAADNDFRVIPGKKDVTDGKIEGRLGLDVRQLDQYFVLILGRVGRPRRRRGGRWENHDE